MQYIASLNLHIIFAGIKYINFCGYSSFRIKLDKLYKNTMDIIISVGFIRTNLNLI